MPFSFTRALSSSALWFFQSYLSVKSSGCSSSGVITIASHTAPVARVVFLISFTTPLTGEWTDAETNDAGWAMSCPFSTLSPLLTTGWAGAPICCESATTSSDGIGRRSMAFPFDRDFLSEGWIPLLNVAPLNTTSSFFSTLFMLLQQSSKRKFEKFYDKLLLFSTFLSGTTSYKTNISLILYL